MDRIRQDSIAHFTEHERIAPIVNALLDQLEDRSPHVRSPRCSQVQRILLVEGRQILLKDLRRKVTGVGSSVGLVLEDDRGQLQAEASPESSELSLSYGSAPS